MSLQFSSNMDFLINYPSNTPVLHNARKIGIIGFIHEKHPVTGWWIRIFWNAEALVGHSPWTPCFEEQTLVFCLATANLTFYRRVFKKPRRIYEFVVK